MGGKIGEKKAVYCFTSVKELTALMLLSKYPAVTDFYEIKHLATDRPVMVHYVAKQKDVLVEQETLDLSLLSSSVLVRLSKRQANLAHKAANAEASAAAAEAVLDKKKLDKRNSVDKKSPQLYEEITQDILSQDLDGRSFELAFFLQKLGFLEKIYAYNENVNFQEKLANILQLYKKFMFNHIHLIFETLDISVKEGFFTNFVTTNSFIASNALLDTPGNNSEVIEKAMNEMASNISVYDNSSSQTKDDIVRKLSNADNLKKIHALLQPKDAIYILQALYKLHQLIQLNGVDEPEISVYSLSLYSALLENDFFALYKKQPFGLYIRQAIRGDLDVPFSQLPNQGSPLEQKALAELKNASLRYLSYLKNLLPADKILRTQSNGELAYDDQVVTSPSERKLFEKYNTVLGLCNILQQENLDVAQRLADFRENFSASRESIASHRDSAGLRWLRTVGYVLGTLGMGLVIPYIRNREFTLFPSEGNKFNNSIDQHLSQVPTM